MTLGQMRHCGTDRLQLICGDPHCGRAILIDADCWPESLRLSDLESLFACPVCGHRGADVRSAREGPSAEPRGANAEETAAHDTMAHEICGAAD
jgi:hypothetical protein